MGGDVEFPREGRRGLDHPDNRVGGEGNFAHNSEQPRAGRGGSLVKAARPLLGARGEGVLNVKTQHLPTPRCAAPLQNYIFELKFVCLLL